MDKLVPPQGVKLEVPAEVLAAFQSVKSVFDAAHNVLWWGAFQQGVLWGVVGVAVVWLFANQRRKP